VARAVKVFLACPAPPHSRKGNRVTAERWAGILRGLGHRAVIGQEYTSQDCDLLVALHARRSHLAAARFRVLHPDRPLIVALTGTDLYRDLPRSKTALASLDLADRLIALQGQAHAALPREARHKVRVIYQSAEPVPNPPPRRKDTFEVCVLGHLRDEKDPFRAALALRRLRDGAGHIRLTHLGQALSPGMERRARAAMARDARYRWLGEVPRGQARRRLAGSHLMVISSRMEGGANVIVEAVVDGVPVLASRVAGNVGMLGEGYPGYYPVGDTNALARLLLRAATRPDFYGRLTEWCAALRDRFRPDAERRAWERLLAEFRDRDGLER
jgi:putative glycosyltransferase (TIGR04348 family)